MYKLLKQLLIDLFLVPFFSYGQEDFLSVYDKTTQRRKHIVEKIASNIEFHILRFKNSSHTT